MLRSSVRVSFEFGDVWVYDIYRQLASMFKGNVMPRTSQRHVFQSTTSLLR